jgi:hypothetical protein
MEDVAERWRRGEFPEAVGMEVSVSVPDCRIMSGLKGVLYLKPNFSILEDQ